MATLAIFNPSWKTLRTICKTVWTPFGTFFLFLTRIPPSISYFRRYMIKWQQQKASAPRIPAHSLIKGLELVNIKTAPQSKIEKVLCDRKIALCFIRNAHFTEVAKLCQASKHLRLMLYRSDGSGKQNMGAIRSNSCQPRSKEECWGCGIQICAGCSVSVLPDVPETTHHLVYCEPRCQQCYFYRLTVVKLRSKSCYHQWGLIPHATQTICSGCSSLFPTDLRKKREVKEAQEISHLSKGYLRCGDCKRKMSQKGRPIWWVCNVCQGECDSSYHSSWSSPRA